MKWLILLMSFTLITFSACSNIQRLPSSEIHDSDRANRVQEIDLELSKFWNNDWRISQKLFQTQKSQEPEQPFDQMLLGDPATAMRVQDLLKEKNHLINELSTNLQLIDWTGIGPWFESTFRPRMFDKEETVEIKSLEDFKLDGPRRNPLPIEHRFYSSYTLRFKNQLPTEKVYLGGDEVNPSQKYLKARLECDADIIYDTGFLIFSRKKTSQVYEFNWYYNQVNAQNVSVQFSPRVTYCQFKFHDPEKSTKWTHGFELIDLSRLSTEWSRLTNQIDVCAQPQGPFTKGIQNFFWQQNFNFTTCPQTYDKLVNLRDPYISMNQKVLALTGSQLGRKDFKDKNPLANLDFSKAPRFDIIWVSSLNFSADFYGMILARALRFHAELGTQIRILVPEVTMAKKDKQIIEWLQTGMPNIKVQYYKYRLSDGADGTWLDKFHRVNHMKLLIGHSATNPTASFLITGGRNIRDSYIFSDTPFYKTYKYLKNYGAGEEDYIYYDDFEVEIRGHSFVKSVMAQMLSFWMRDPITQRFRSTNINIPKQATNDDLNHLAQLSEEQPIARHIVSLPFFDGYQLEKFYIDMIDSANSEIILTTPYFRPSVAISSSLDRAVQRGVAVKVVTRIHLAGDGTPQIAEDVNKQGINRHLNDVAIYEWTDDKSIMHAKILVIDKKLSFVSSVNLNRRSFIHDTESGVLILHSQTADMLRNEVLGFLRKSRRITDQERISWINSTLIDWADSYF